MSGNIPWLIIVPIIAVVLEFVDHHLGVAVRLPFSIFLLFAITVTFASAHLVYALGCPGKLKGIESIEEWHQRNSLLRQKIIEALNQGKTLRDTLDHQVEHRIDEVLLNAPGKKLFSPGEIKVIKFHLLEAVKRSTNFIGENIDQVVETSPNIFHELNVKKPLLRFLCLLALTLSFAFVGIQIVLRLISVYRATFG